MQHGERFRLHSDETYGARKGRSTHGALMTYQLNFGLAQLNKRNISILDSDATGCYDRIPHNLLSIAQQRMGCRKPFAMSHAKTLHNMIHRILTAHGVSSANFTKMLAGVGQGSSNGPSGWHSVCEVIMAAYRDLNPGCRWTSPNRMLEEVVWLAGFVDDVVKFRGFPDDSTWDDTLAATQASYRSWQHLLAATGGSLSLAKSSYSMVFWIPDRFNNLIMASKAVTQGSLSMQANNEKVTIERKEPWDACKDLGVFLAPDGNMTAQFEACMKRAREMKTMVNSAPISRMEADVFFHTRYMGWTRYFLPITTFSKSQCLRI